MTDLILDLTDGAPRHCSCGRRIYKSRGVVHDQCSRCRDERHPARFCECGTRLLGIYETCAECRGKVTKRFCGCGQRIYDGHGTCTGCRYGKTEPVIVWENHHGIKRAVYAYPRRGR